MNHRPSGYAYQLQLSLHFPMLENFVAWTFSSPFSKERECPPLSLYTFCSVGSFQQAEKLYTANQLLYTEQLGSGLPHYRLPRI